jgi:hypothetical protein
MLEMQHLLNNYKTPPRQQCAKDLDSNGITFIQIGPPCKARTVANIDCWHSQKKGHYKSNCLKLKAQELDVGMQNLSINTCKEEQSLFSANKGWVMMCVFLASGYRWVTVMHEIPISSAHPLTFLPYPRAQ